MIRTKFTPHFAQTGLVLLFLILCHDMSARTKSKLKATESDTLYTSRAFRSYEIPMGRDAIDVHPFSFVAGAMMISYERAFSLNFGTKIIAAFGSGDKSDYYADVQKFHSYYLEFQPRYYFSSIKTNARVGLYISPTLYYKLINFNRTETTIDNGVNISYVSTDNQASAFGIGYIAGYRAEFDYGIHADFYLGGVYNNSSGDYKKILTNTGVDSYHNQIQAQLGFSLGLSF